MLAWDTNSKTMASMYLPTIFLTLGMYRLLLHSVVELVFMVPQRLLVFSSGLGFDDIISNESLW